MSDRCPSCGTSDFFNHEALCAYTPKTKPCATSQQLLADTQAKLFEQTVLKEFLNEDESLDDTIDNLTQMLERMAIVNHCISRSTLFNARRALVSLETLKITMEVGP